MPFKEDELVLAQQIAGLAIWEWNIESDDVRWLPGSTRLFGRDMNEVGTRRQIREHILAEDLESVKAAEQEAIRNGSDYSCEYRVKWPNDEIHWVRSRGRIVTSPGREKLMIGVAQDVSGAKIREGKLRAQARLLELAYEPILVRDANDRITYWNHGAERLYGYSSLEATGQTSHELLCTKFPEALRQIQATLMRRGFWEGDLIHSTKDNRLVHVLSRWQQFSNGGMSTLETNFDLSQQKALQVAKMWEEKAKLLGELSHEINNPLAAAANAAHLLKGGCDETAQDYLAILQDSIMRIAEFIRKSNELHHAGRAEETGLLSGRRTQ